ncbi:IS110 family transposase [Companilactobacillus nuruki]|uniref:IS110 family transposase n=1 Tax=Companilactobacillus nuruki TaxID=1993540 RepID=A0A2N7AR08_9LACO|nr:IS110 family transposase [Companilactobacillus nuruki]
MLEKVFLNLITKRKILFKTVLNIISGSKHTPVNISLSHNAKKSSGSKGTKKIVISANVSSSVNNEMYDTKMFLAEH